ncbi:hypothetical protein M7M4_05840 [Corynebacterium pseudogenitalium]
MAKYPYRCPQTDHYVSDPSQCSSPMGSGTSDSDSDLPAAMTRTGEVEEEHMRAHKWWADCVNANSPEYCRENDPWQRDAY